MSSPAIQWYPGHIAKAERALREQLKLVDVVLEVRDARIPLSTEHPQVSQWIVNKERVLVLNRLDMVSSEARRQWTEWFRTQGQEPLYTDAQHGKGINAVTKATQVVGAKVNQKRGDRGMLPRPVRAVVIGFPNVGKSALINRLLNRRAVDSARRAGVTRQLRWVKISDQIELLDAPGVLPARLNDQEAAFKLAICDDIGQAAYDNQRVASTLLDLLKGFGTIATLRDRYELDPALLTGESYLHALAQAKHQGDVERTARQLLHDFRKGTLGAIALEYPPT